MLFAYIPFYTLQAHEDGLRWCHVVGQDVVWFKRFGITQNYHKKDGEKMDSFDMVTNAHKLLYLYATGAYRWYTMMLQSRKRYCMI